MFKNFNLTKKKWSRRAVVLLLEKIELYLSAGLSLDKVCGVIAEGMSVPSARLMHALRQDIEKGVSLSVALVQHIGIPATAATLIRQGELSGQLPKALSIARIMIEKSDSLIQSCISALVYPLLIGLCTGAITLGLLRGVMPQITPMLLNLRVDLPLLTQVVIAVSEWLVSYGWYIVAACSVLTILNVYLYRKYYSYRKNIHHILIRIPISGSIYRSYHISIFLRSLGILIDSGLSLSYVYPQVVTGISLIPLRDIFSSRNGDISKGVSLGVIVRHPWVAEYVPPLVSAGEKSGTLGLSLVRGADILDRDIERSLKRMTSLIEPVMMVGMGCLVGAIALSIMLPIYDISKVLQH